MKEYITDGGRRFVKTSEGFTTGNGQVKVSPQQMKQYLKHTNTNLHEARNVSANLVDGARAEDRARGRQEQQRRQNIRQTMNKYGLK